MSKYTEDQVRRVSELSLSHTPTEISIILDIPRSTVSSWIKRFPNPLAKETRTINLFDVVKQSPDQEIVDKSVDLARKTQRLMDSNRIERKTFREHARHVNAIEDLNKALINTFTMRKFQANTNTVEYKPQEGVENPPIGVLQLSDLHLNMVVSDIQGNVFNLDIASKRLYKHVATSINQFKAEGVQKVVLALTGDLVKNIQHLSEISSNSISRSNCVFIAVDFFSQIIKHLNDEGFNVVVASVVGNESRTMEHIHETDFLASDSFDLMIHKILHLVWDNKPGVTFIPMTNMVECQLKLYNTNILLVHGNLHGRLASTAGIESQTDKLVARYSQLGIKIDYVICGHIHQAFISDKFARSGGLPGNDEYAGRKLNLFGRASQNSYIVYEDGTINGYKNDLQYTNGWLGYPYDDIAAKLSIQNQVRSGGMGHNTVMSINGYQFAGYTV